MALPRLDRVLVTGASGTLGYNIARHLAEERPKTSVHTLVRQPDPGLFEGYPNIFQQRIDMLDRASLARATLDFQPNAIIHCAATGVRPSSASWFEIIDLNVGAAVDLFRVSCEIPSCHFLHVSTGLVYAAQDRPCHEGDSVDTLHPYGASKAASDSLLRAGAERLDRHLTVVRPFSFTGLHDGGKRLFPSLLRHALEGKPMSMSPGTQLRDFCAVDDVTSAISTILDHHSGHGRNIYNIGSGRAIALRQLVEDVVRELDLDVELRFGDLPLHPYEPHQLVSNIDRLRALGWKPNTNLAHAVWQLARSQFPDLRVREPRRINE